MGDFTLHAGGHSMNIHVMAVRTVLKMGDPRLLERARPVDRFDDRLHALVKDMRETMAALNGAGLAAPQIGMPLRIVIFGLHANSRYPDAEEVPDSVLINPSLTIIDKSVEQGWEGCLSLPGLRGMVPRCREVRYEGVDACGQPIDRHVGGFHARVIQHECDHLDGILYPMRMDDLSRFGFEEALFAEPA